MSALKADNFKHYVDRFNETDVEDVVNLVPNAAAWDWMSANIPLFECPESATEEMYYYRWWTYRKHIVQTPVGLVLTEFITPVKHAGAFNTISCALGLHLAEGRWLRDQRLLDEYTRFWFRGNNGGPQPKFHNYSQWVAWAMRDRAYVTGDESQLVELLDDLIADYAHWEQERQLPEGLFWQYDVRDGMEESISGSRKAKNKRPTINSYMYANAVATGDVSRRHGRLDAAAMFEEKAATLRKLTLGKLWDPAAKFFKVRFEDGTLSSAREEIGFIPWMFDLPPAKAGYEAAWAQLTDPEGFSAPFGITTAERRHPQFRTHGVGKCEWDGAVWPFATSQTLMALANVLRRYPQTYVTKRNYLEAMQTYVKSMHKNGQPFVGEYLDEKTGAWLTGDNPRSRYYNHSTFADLVISGLVGIVPRGDKTVEVSPLLPAEAWDWFCLDGVPYHGRTLTIRWDRDGKRYGQNAGLVVEADGKQIEAAPTLDRLTAELQ